MSRQPKFYLGQTVITRRALTTLTPEEVIAALGNHVVGEWGELHPRLAAANEEAVENDSSVVSAHRSRSAGVRFFVVTSADRSQTTVFLPGDR
jgi:hypothetical protein